jgi:hypothetical protein
MDPEKALLHNGTPLSGQIRENIISSAIHIPLGAVSSTVSFLSRKTCLCLSHFVFVTQFVLVKQFLICVLLLYRYLFVSMDIVFLLLPTCLHQHLQRWSRLLL